MAEKKRPISKSIGTKNPTTTPEPANRDFTQYVATKQAADMLGVDHQHVAHLLKAGKLKGIKLGHDWLVFLPSVHTYAKTKSPKGRPASRRPKL